MFWIHPDATNKERHDELAHRLQRAERAGDVSLATRLRRAAAVLLEVEWLRAFEGLRLGESDLKELMAAGVMPVAGAAWGPREPRRGIKLIDEYVAAAITTGTNKKEWLLDAAMELLGIRWNTGATDRTTSSDIIDMNKNGTTIFTTQANRPTQAAATANDWTVGFPDGARSFVAGDMFAYDIDQASTGGTGKTRVSGAFAFRYN